MAAQTNSLVTFTAEEQRDLQNLQANLELFNLLKALLVQGSFPGSASVALIRCQQFADNIIVQTNKQIEDINKSAASRSQGSEKESNTKENQNG